MTRSRTLLSMEEVALFYVMEEVALLSAEEVAHCSGVCRDTGLPTSTHLLPLTKA